MLLAQGYRVIAGVDEVGRGSLAGPLVAAAVILPLENDQALEALSQVRDSKQLSPVEREDAWTAIRRISIAVGIGWSSHHVIDERGLTAANRHAMQRAVARLAVRPDSLLIDYLRLPDCLLPQVCIPHGDERSLSIAAASIVAKVVRDGWMASYENQCPDYGFGEHKGYGTPSHRQALASFGPSPIHRLTFRPLSLLADAK